MPAKKTTTKSKATTKKTTTKKATTKKKAASPKSRSASSKAKSKKKAGEREVTIDRRTKADRRDETTEATPKVEKREKVQRRRQIDPTTCERDYSEQEVQFMNAMDEYKRTSGRMFPTCSEVLEVIRDLGYVQLTPAEIAIVRPELNEENQSADESGEESEADEFEAAELAV